MWKKSLVETAAFVVTYQMNFLSPETFVLVVIFRKSLLSRVEHSIYLLLIFISLIKS